MTKSYPLVPLGDLLKRADNWIEIEPTNVYTQITIKLWGQGVVQRNRIYGSELSATRRNVVRNGQFIISRIDARNGASGLVPRHLDGAIVSNDFPTYNIASERLDPGYMEWLSKSDGFVRLCQQASEGSTNRVRLKEDKFLSLRIPLPSLSEQCHLATKVQSLAARLAELDHAYTQQEANLDRLLLQSYLEICSGVQASAMGDIAPLLRRPVEVTLSGLYPELGVRSFGKGTFHKLPLTGADVGTKRLFRIEPGDLIFNIVFAWEGAIAVASAADRGRVGSHRFLTCVPDEDRVFARFIWFHFLTDTGLKQLGAASPGGAGRNRTLGIRALEAIRVPVPPLSRQRWFVNLLNFAECIRSNRESTPESTDVIRAILHQLVDTGPPAR